MPREIPDNAKLYYKENQQNGLQNSQFKLSAETQKEGFNFFGKSSIYWVIGVPQIPQEAEECLNQEAKLHESMENANDENFENNTQEVKSNILYKKNIIIQGSHTLLKQRIQQFKNEEISQPNMEADKLVDGQNLRFKKKQDLRKLNAVKNFMRRFAKLMNSQQQKKKILVDHKQGKNELKKMLSNLNKKIKYLNKCISLRDFQKMLRHENYEHILKKQCLEFIEIYPQEVKNSKIKDLSIIENLLQDFKQLINGN